MKNGWAFILFATLGAVGPLVAQPAAPVLVSPSGLSSNRLPTYTWNVTNGASEYYLWVDGPSGGVLRQWHAAAAICGGVTCSFQPSAPLGEGAHVFWVQAKNALGVGPWSAAMRFTVSSFAGPPPSASLVSPAGAGTLTQPTYVWNAVSTSTDYYLWVDGPSGNVLKQWYPSSALCDLTTCSVTPAQTLAAGAHTWWIQTKNTVGVGPWSAAKTFTVVTGGAASPPPAPALQSPSGIITATRPSYNWTAATTATDYYLWVNGPLGPILQQWYFASAVCSGSTCAVAPPTTLASGAHTWWVQASNGAGTGPWSAAKAFTVVTDGTTAPPAAPALQSPSGIISATRPSYSWTAASGATDYYLWVNGPLGQPVLQQWYFASAVCSGSTCAVAPATTLASGAHTWWVQAKNGAGTGPWSASRSFTVQPQAATDSYFPSGAVWYQDVSSAALDPQSSQVIAWLQSAGGWGLGRMQIDFSIEVVAASAGTPLRAFIPTQDHFSPDCDVAPVPLPPGGALEGESGYECTSDGDCHLIVVQRSTNRLYEMWRANVIGDAFFGGCLAVWDMSRVYGPAGRGENCTSADAAGYPIAPLLFSADEVARGEIPHAIRFILPNSRMRNGVYVHPATHSTGATSGPSSAPPYGARFRLRPDFPLNTLPNEAARVVARALQRYGMFLADGGNVALTAQSDRFTPAKWSGLLGSRDLSAIQVSDFQMVDGGERLPYTGDCVRVQD